MGVVASIVLVDAAVARAQNGLERAENGLETNAWDRIDQGRRTKPGRPFHPNTPDCARICTGHGDAGVADGDAGVAIAGSRPRIVGSGICFAAPVRDKTPAACQPRGGNHELVPRHDHQGTGTRVARGWNSPARLTDPSPSSSEQLLAPCATSLVPAAIGGCGDELDIQVTAGPLDCATLTRIGFEWPLFGPLCH
jgi:hypothetical protein